MNELRPCPFCGGEAEIVEVTRHIENNKIVAKCQVCGASTKTFGDKAVERCIGAWNLRKGSADETDRKAD